MDKSSTCMAKAGNTPWTGLQTISRHNHITVALTLTPMESPVDIIMHVFILLEWDLHSPPIIHRLLSTSLYSYFILALVLMYNCSMCLASPPRG